MGRTSGSRRRGLLVTVAGGVAVAAVAAGASYAARGSDPAQPAGAPGGPDRPSLDPAGHRPPLPPLQTDAADRAAAVALATTTLSAVGSYPGAVSSGPIRGLGDHTLSTATPAGHTVVRSSYDVVTGVGAKAVARWYAVHPPAGFSSGGAGSVGGQGDGTTWINEVYDEQPGGGLGAPGTSVEVETTAIGEGVGVRVTVSSVWAPARPRTSYVQDVRSIDVRSVHRRIGRDTTERSVRAFTVSDPARVLRAAVAYDRLSGMTAMALPCPLAIDSWTDRIVFHTATGDVTVTGDSALCGYGLTVHRDGQRVEPMLDGTDVFFAALGLRH